MNARDLQFNRRVIKPVHCFREAWRFAKEDFWLFFGITILAVFFAGLGPMGILMGPAYCGVYLCFLDHESGERASVGTLFSGFNFFGPSFVATLWLMIPMMAAMTGVYMLMCGGMFTLIAMQAEQPRGAPPDGAFFVGMMGLSFGFSFVLLVVITIVAAPFVFAYPLIVDKGLSGTEAVGLSIRAFFANLWGLTGLLFLALVMLFLGMSLCVVGLYLEMPFHFAITWIAYRQVFPRRDPLDDFRHDDEPAIPMQAAAVVDTAVTVNPEDRPAREHIQ
jgi:uncharacterized membrane protein